MRQSIIMKILVTGAVGFIGSHTAERLQKLGHQVIGVDNFSPYYSEDLKKLNEKALNDQGISVLKLDLREDNLIDSLPGDIEYIFHYAAQPGISSSSSFEDYFSNNILATKNLIDYALQLPALKMFVNNSVISLI